MLRHIALISAFLWVNLCLSAPIEKSNRPSLMYGTVANTSQYPELILVDNYLGECTATLIGPSVFITAAHCGADLSTSEFDYNGTRYTATIYWFESTSKIDIALGLLDTPITGIQYASIGTDPVSVGSELTLLGYGCHDYEEDHVDPEIWHYKYDGKLREGVSELVSYDQHWLEIERKNGAVTCFGDSGGPSFQYVNGKKYLVGVHSESDGVMSWDIRMDIKEVKDYFDYFVTTYSVDICGINTSC